MTVPYISGELLITEAQLFIVTEAGEIIQLEAFTPNTVSAEWGSLEDDQEDEWSVDAEASN